MVKQPLTWMAQAQHKLRDPLMTHYQNMNQVLPQEVVEKVLTSEEEYEEEEEEEEEEPEEKEKDVDLSPVKEPEVKALRPQTVWEPRICYNPDAAADRFRAWEIVECPFIIWKWVEDANDPWNWKKKKKKKKKTPEELEEEAKKKEEEVE